MPPSLHRPAAVALVALVLGVAIVGSGAAAYAREPLAALACGVVGVGAVVLLRELRGAP